MKALIEENNVVSLRTAYVHDDGDIVAFNLMPAWTESSIPGTKPKRRDFSWTFQDFAWLYRHMRSVSDEERLAQTYPPIVQQDIKPLRFAKPPEFKLIWTDSGNGVAVYLDGEAWAFIDEKTQKGYSKGVLPPKRPHFAAVGNLWNQVLFEKYFETMP